MIEPKDVEKITLVFERKNMKGDIWVDCSGNEYNVKDVTNTVNNRKRVISGQFINENGKWIFYELTGYKSSYNAGKRFIQ